MKVNHTYGLRRAAAGTHLSRSGGLLAALFGVAAMASLSMPAVAAGAEVVNIGIPNVATDVGFFLADQEGYFKDEGIEVKFTPFPSAAGMIAPLGAGQLDVGGGAISAGFFNAVDRGINIRIVADKGADTAEYEYSTIVIRKDLVDSGKYKSLADLKGLTLAASAQGANSESQINQVLQQAGLKYEDVKVVYLSYPEMYAALKNKAIDGGVSNEPTLSSMVKDGVAVRASDKSLFPGYQTAVVFFSQSFAEKRKDVAQKFMRAYIRAVRDYNDGLQNGKFVGPKGDAVIAALTKYTAVKDPDIYRNMTPFVVNPNGTVNPKSLDTDLAFFKERKLVPDRVQLAPYLDTSFVDWAVSDLGAYKKAP
ncbi:MAG TPA: ABC transporter substrate-binding protein [Devosiaceae bacterium]|jgi:NitT/TauT family transport system substrate-binding protein